MESAAVCCIYHVYCNFTLRVTNFVVCINKCADDYSFWKYLPSSISNLNVCL